MAGAAGPANRAECALQGLQTITCNSRKCRGCFAESGELGREPFRIGPDFGFGAGSADAGIRAFDPVTIFVQTGEGCEICCSGCGSLSIIRDVAFAMAPRGPRLNPKSVIWACRALIAPCCSRLRWPSAPAAVAKTRLEAVAKMVSVFRVIGGSFQWVRPAITLLCFRLRPNDAFVNGE